LARTVERPCAVHLHRAAGVLLHASIKIGAFGGLVLAFPVIASQLYRFIAPGLYRNERQAFLPYLVATPVLFLLGAALVYFLIIPMAMWFFLSMEQTGGEGLASIQHLPKVSEYLSLIMTLIFAFGVVFQLPVAITLLARAGLVTTEGLAEETQIRHRHRIRGGRDPDAARSADPDRPRGSDLAALRTVHHLGPLCRKSRNGSVKPSMADGKTAATTKKTTTESS
jgi:hypothetical protein